MSARGALTRYLGVIGWPVAHSHSPAMQEAAFAALGLDWRYGAFAVRPERLADAVRGAAALGFVGLNVTVPHKEAALALCRPDAIAASLGAVNTLVFDEPDRQPRGLNTDLHGFRMLLAEADVEARGARALVLGAGGAARAVVHALREAGAAVTVVTRSGRHVRLEGQLPVEHVPWGAKVIAERLGAADLLVDATPRGLDAGSSLDLAPLPPRAVVIDLVARASTPLVEAARRRGLRAATGEAMLLHQGAAALEAFSGRPAPLEAMRRALAASLRPA